MTVALHSCISGRLGRIQAIRKFLDYLASFKDIWVTNRYEIAKHWCEQHLYEK